MRDDGTAYGRIGRRYDGSDAEHGSIDTTLNGGPDANPIATAW